MWAILHIARSSKSRPECPQNFALAIGMLETVVVHEIPTQMAARSYTMRSVVVWLVELMSFFSVLPCLETDATSVPLSESTTPCWASSAELASILSHVWKTRTSDADWQARNFRHQVTLLLCGKRPQASKDSPSDGRY